MIDFGYFFDVIFKSSCSFLDGQPFVDLILYTSSGDTRCLLPISASRMPYAELAAQPAALKAKDLKKGKSSS